MKLKCWDDEDCENTGDKNAKAVTAAKRSIHVTSLKRSETLSHANCMRPEIRSRFRLVKRWVAT